MAGFDEKKLESLLGSKGQELMKDHVKSTKAATGEMITYIEKIKNSEERIAKLVNDNERATGDALKQKVNQLKSMASALDAQERHLAALKSGHAQSTNNMFVKSMGSAVGDKNNASDINRYSKSSDTLGQAQSLADRKSSYELEQHQQQQYSMLRQQNQAIIAMAPNVGKDPRAMGQMNEMLANAEDTKQAIGINKQAMGYQSKTGETMGQQSINYDKFAAAIRKERKEADTTEKAGAGKLGSLDQSSNKMKEAQDKFIASITEYNDLIDKNLSKQAGEVGKNLKGLAAAAKEAEFAHKANTAAGGGGEGRGGFFAGAMRGLGSDAVKGGALMAREYYGVKQFQDVDSVMQQYGQRTQYASQANRAFEDIHGVAGGDASSLRRVMTDQLGMAATGGKAMGSAMDRAKTGQFVASATLLAQQGAQAVVNRADPTAGGKGGTSKKMGKIAAKVARLGGATATVGLIGLEAGGDIASMAGSVAKEGISQKRGLDSNRVALDTANMMLAQNDTINKVPDILMQGGIDYGKDLTKATRGLGYGPNRFSGKGFEERDIEFKRGPKFGGGIYGGGAPFEAINASSDPSKGERVSQKVTQVPMTQEDVNAFSSESPIISVTEATDDNFLQRGWKDLKRMARSMMSPAMSKGAPIKGKLNHSVRGVEGPKNNKASIKNANDYNTELRSWLDTDYAFGGYKNAVKGTPNNGDTGVGFWNDFKKVQNSGIDCSGLVQQQLVREGLISEKTGKLGTDDLEKLYDTGAIAGHYLEKGEERQLGDIMVMKGHTALVSGKGTMIGAEGDTGQVSEYNWNKYNNKGAKFYRPDKTAGKMAAQGTAKKMAAQGMAAQGTATGSGGKEGDVSQRITGKTRLGSGDRDAMMKKLFSVEGVNELAGSGLDRKEIAETTGQGVGALGKQLEFDDIKQMGQLRSTGLIQSTGQGMQMRGELSKVGVGREGFAQMLRVAVASGMDSSKNISQMVSATTQLSQGAAMGGSNQAGTVSNMLAASAQASGLDPNMAIGAGVNAMGFYDMLTQGGGITADSVTTYGRFNEEFKDADKKTLTNMAITSGKDIQGIADAYKVTKEDRARAAMKGMSAEELENFDPLNPTKGMTLEESMQNRKGAEKFANVRGNKESRSWGMHAKGTGIHDRESAVAASRIKKRQGLEQLAGTFFDGDAGDFVERAMEADARNEKFKMTDNDRNNINKNINLMSGGKKNTGADAAVGAILNPTVEEVDKLKETSDLGGTELGGVTITETAKAGQGAKEHAYGSAGLDTMGGLEGLGAIIKKIGEDADMTALATAADRAATNMGLVGDSFGKNVVIIETNLGNAAAKLDSIINKLQSVADFLPDFNH